MPSASRAALPQLSYTARGKLAPAPLIRFCCDQAAQPTRLAQATDPAAMNKDRLCTRCSPLSRPGSPLCAATRTQKSIQETQIQPELLMAVHENAGASRGAAAELHLRISTKDWKEDSSPCLNNV